MATNQSGDALVEPGLAPPQDDSSVGRAVGSRGAVADLLLVSFSILLYVITTSYDFVADDRILLENNPYVQSFHYLREIFTRTLWSFQGARGQSTYYRPLVMLALLLERQVFGLRPAGFHLVNVLLNAGVVAMALVLGKRLWPGTPGGALWAGLLFASLPVHSEDVAPVSGISDLLCAFFFVLALVIYTQSGNGRPGRLSWLSPWAAAVAFLLAALCKEVALVLPCLVVFYEHFLRPLGAPFVGATERAGTRPAPSLPSEGHPPSHLKRATRYAPMFLALAVYFGFRIEVVGGLGMVLSANRLAWKEACIFGLSQIGNYVFKLIWPQHLTYAWKFQPPQTWWDPSVLFGGFVVALALAAFIRFWRRQRAAGFAALWFFLTLAPALNLAGVGVTAYGERYLYLPSMAVCWLVGEAGACVLHSSQRASRGRALQGAMVWGFLVLLVAAATLRTVFRLPAWKSNMALAQATLAEDPNSAIYHLYLGNGYRERGERQLARIEYVQAIALDPTVGEAYLDLAGILFDDGQEAAGRDFLERAVEANPRMAAGYFELGREELRQHHPDQAQMFLERAVALDPNHFETLYLLGGLARDAGRLREAADFFTRALEANPASADAHLSLGAVMSRQGDDQGAEAEFRRAIALAPNSDAPYLDLAALLEEEGKQDAALNAYRLAIQAQPSSANAYFRLGVLALKMGRVEEATHALEYAVRIQPTSALAHLQLGLAYRAAGRLPDAHREIQDALRIDPGLGGRADLR